MPKTIFIEHNVILTANKPLHQPWLQGFALAAAIAHSLELNKIEENVFCSLWTTDIWIERHVHTGWIVFV